MKIQAGWLTRRLLPTMIFSGILMCAGTGRAQNGNGNGRGPANTPPGLSDEKPGNSGNSNGNGANPNSNNNGKKSGKDTLDVVALPATGSAGSLTPLLPDEESAEWRYVACLPEATSINETFPLQFKLQNYNDHPGDSVEIELDPAGRLADAVILTDKFPLLDNGVAEIKNILLAADNLSSGAYTLNILLKVSPQRGVSLSQHMVHIHILVGAACSGGPVDEPTAVQPTTPPANNPLPPSGPLDTTAPPAAAGTGFFTDGDFNLLENCSGQDVSDNHGGTYAIVARPQSKIISSTNPGTFYLNWIWENSGSEKNITIELSSLNLASRGANAVHVALFDANGFSSNADNFDLVNEDGNPCGPNGPCTVKVQSGKKLWLSWHLAFAGRGQSAENISATCGQGLAISATATLKENGSALASTTVNATGYVK